MRLLFVIMILQTLALHAYSQTRPSDDPDTVRRVERAADLANKVVDALQTGMENSKISCFADCAGDTQSPPSCSDAYKSLYSKPDVHINISLGYTDFAGDILDSRGDFVRAEDHIRRQVWEQRLMQDCPPGVEGTCGFIPDPDDGDHYTKDVTGPDGRPHTIHVHLASSSSDYYDTNNRTPDRKPKKPCTYLNADVAARTSAAQYAQSCEAAKNFYNGLSGSDVVIYAGHARLGGGPDFAPPIQKPNSLLTDESAYANRALENRMLSALRGNTTPPKLVGIFACNAGDHFSDEIREATSGKTGVVSAIGYTEPEIVFAQAYAMLDSVLAFRCENEFDQETNLLKNVNRHPRVVGQGVRRDGFIGYAAPRAPSLPTGAKRNETPLVPQKAIHPAGPAAPTGKKTQSSGAVK